MIFDILPLIAGLFCLALGVVVLVSGTDSKGSKWPFVLFACSVGLWAVFVGLFSLVANQTLATIFVAVYYIAALAIAYNFLVFSFSFVHKPLRKSISIIALLPWIAMSVLIVMPNFFIGTVNGATSDVSLVLPTYIVYSALFSSYVLIGLGYMTLRAFRSHRHNHLRALIISLAICLAGGAYFNLILPLFGDYQWIGLGPLFAFLMVASVFYAIARHGLFDIRQAVVRTVAYGLSLITLAGVYLLVAFIIFNVLLGQTATVGQTFLNIVLTLTLAFIFQPIKKFFDRVTNRLFYKDVYNIDDFYAKLNTILSETTDLRKLLKRTSEMIADMLKSEQVFIFVYVGDKGSLSDGTNNHTKLPYRDARELDHYGGLIQASAHELPINLRRLLKSHKLAMVMPIVREDGALGLLCLGEHLTSKYTSRDRRVLRTISDELGIAIQNALSVQEIKNLNSSLEQRINSATRELRASNAQLQRLDEAKDEFISMASHQLRTPLTSIKGYISMLMEGDVGKVSPDQKHLLQEAFVSSERMVRLIGDFLNVSRLQTGKFIIDKQPVDLAKLVARELEALEPNASARELKFTYKQPKNFPKLNLDENKIQQVIMNFADNAIYYSKEKSTIKVSLSVVASRVEFTVKDTGIGVPIAEQAQLFNKFFRATNARKQRPDGTGVGLFLAKKVIDAHDGKIIFSSKENKGSTFGFSLPIAKLRVRDTN
ncbi:MAG: ATP-binding protein [Candidatus Microsaccharimonas sp.]